MNLSGNQNVITNMAKNCLISVLIHVIAEIISVYFQRICQRKNDVTIAVGKHSRDINKSLNIKKNPVFMSVYTVMP